MLPRSGSIESVGSSASSCARPSDRRRADAHARDAPRSAPQSASRGSSRSQIRADRQAFGVRRRHVLRGVHGDVDAPSSNASSSSLTNTPREPISPNGRVRSRSPAVVIGTSASSIPGARSRAAAQLGLREREPTAAGTDADQHDTMLRFGSRLTAHALRADERARTRSAPARAAAARSGSRSSALVLETEEVTHRVSINHPIGCRGGLFHANCRQMQELVQDRRGHRLRGAPLRVVELRALEARRRGSPPHARGAT